MKKVLIICDIPIDSLDKLRKNFDIERIYDLYNNEDLASWLQYHGYLSELRQLTFVHNTTDIALKMILLALILGADFNKINVLNQNLLTKYLASMNDIKNQLGTKFHLDDVTHLHFNEPKMIPDSSIYHEDSNSSMIEMPVSADNNTNHNFAQETNTVIIEHMQFIVPSATGDICGISQGIRKKASYSYSYSYRYSYSYSYRRGSGSYIGSGVDPMLLGGYGLDII